MSVLEHAYLFMIALIFDSAGHTVYIRIHKWKNYWNQSIFAKVIVKI